MPRLLTLVVVVAAALPVSACSIPVFRYALERWKPARYELVVYHKGPLADADKAILRRFDNIALNANLEVVRHDLAGTKVSADLQKIWDREGNGRALPYCVLRYPEAKADLPSAWSGPLDAGELSRLLDSPARRAVRDKLAVGYAGVVVVVHHGDKSADALVVERLRKQLAALAEVAELPAPTKEGPQLKSPLPLRVAFPVVEIDRDGAEAAFARMLLSSEEGSAKAKGPVAFPIFGRGRALWRCTATTWARTS